MVAIRELARQLRTDIPADLREYQDEMMRPFLELDRVEFDPARLEWRLAPEGTELRRIVDIMIGYGYAVRYRDPRPGAPLFPPMVHCDRVFALTQRFEDRDIVIGTGRVRWDAVEVLELFEIDPPGRWPHEEMGQEFGEIAKFSVHPAIDALLHMADPDLRAVAARYRVVMWQKLGELFDEGLAEHDRTYLYFLSSPHVTGWLERAGYSGTCVEAARPSSSETMRRMREDWARYFLPHEPRDQQPHAYFRPVRVPCGVGGQEPPVSRSAGAPAQRPGPAR